MRAAEKRQMETELLSMGLAGLAADGKPSAELVQQIASLVNGWQGSVNRHGEWIDRHMFLRDLLAECDAAARVEMCRAIVPHLNFPAKTLSDYEAMIASRINVLTSKGVARAEGREPHPIEVGGKKFIEVPAHLATDAIVTVRCLRCWKKKRFLSDTPAGAMIAARKAGWARIGGRETCPNCVRKLMATQKREAAYAN